ncbi:MAG: hypothetical protein ABIF87_10125 [Pseudomonadota bacterium]
MELIIGVIIGIIGIGFTVFYGVRSKKYERYLEGYRFLDIHKRELLKRLEILQTSNEQKETEIAKLRSKIAEIDKVSDAVHEHTFDPRKLKWSDKCPKCAKTMGLSDVDYWYRCRDCGYEQDGLIETTS